MLVQCLPKITLSEYVVKKIIIKICYAISDPANKEILSPLFKEEVLYPLVSKVPNGKHIGQAKTSCIFTQQQIFFNKSLT